MTLSDPITAQLVSHDHPRFILQTLKQSLEEALRCLGIAPRLNQNVEHNAMLIDGPPHIMLYALDADENFIHVPLVAGSWSKPAQSVGLKRAAWVSHAASSACVFWDLNPSDAGMRGSLSRADSADLGLQHAVECVVLEQVAFLEIGTEGAVAGVPAELLEP